MRRGIIYSVEIIILVFVVLFYVHDILFGVKTPDESIIIKKNYEISLTSMLSSMLNQKLWDYIFNYQLDLIYFLLSGIIKSYFTDFTFEVSYYDEILINSPIDTIDNVTFFYPLPYVTGDPLFLSKTIELFDNRLEKQKIYIETDWWMTYVYDTNLSRNYTSKVWFKFPKQDYRIDNYSFFVFSGEGIPLKINELYIDSLNNYIYLNITNFYSPSLLIIYRAVNDTTINQLEYLRGRYSINTISNAYLLKNTSTTKSSWITIYANLKLKKGMNKFYIRYTYLSKYIRIYTDNSTKIGANSSYKVYIPKHRFFYYTFDVSKMLPVLGEGDVKYSDSIWLIDGKSIVNLKVYAT